MKFKFHDQEYDLEEVVGKDTILQLRKDSNDVMLTNDAMLKLQHKFPSIDIQFGSIQICMMNGAEVLALEGKGIDRDKPDSPIIRRFGEISTKNSKDLGLTFPVATLESRTRNRVMIAMLGLTGTFDEESVDAATKASVVSREATKEAEVKDGDLNVWISNVKTLCSSLNLTNEQRMDAYREVLGDNSSTPEQIGNKLTVEVCRKTYTLIKDTYEKKKGN